MRWFESGSVGAPKYRRKEGRRQGGLQRLGREFHHVVAVTGLLYLLLDIFSGAGKPVN